MIDLIITGLMYLGVGLFLGCVGAMAYVVVSCRLSDCILPADKPKAKSMLMDDNY